MSGHAFPEGGDKGKEKRLIPAEGTTTQLISTGNLQQPIRYPPEILATLSGSVRQTFVNRPIAPAPGPNPGILAAAVNVTSSKPGGATVQSQHTLVSRLQAPTLDPVMLQAAVASQASLNLTSQSGGGTAAAHPALHIATGPGSVSLHSLSGPTSLTLSHAGQITMDGRGQRDDGTKARDDTKDRGSKVTVMGPIGTAGTQDKSRQPPMASLIRTSHPQHSPISLAVSQRVEPGNTTTSHSSATHQQASVIHAMPSHIPRGAAAASALSGPKGNTVATPILRPSHPQALGSISAGSANQLLAAGGLQAQLPPRAILPVRPGTPPVTQMSLAVTTVSLPQTHPDLHRTASHLVGAVTTTSSVHLAVPRVLTEISGKEMSGRPLVTHPLQKGAALSQTLVQQAVGQTAQKVAVSQLISASGAAGNPPTIVSMAPRPPVQNVALNLAQPLTTVARGPKLLPGQTVTQTGPGPLAAGQVTHTIPRHQKIVVTTTPPNLPTVVAAKAAAGLNLRPPKLVMSHLTVTTAPTLPITIATLTKSLPAGVGLATAAQSHGTATVAITTAIPSPATGTTIPIAKVTPQRQIALTHPVGESGQSASTQASATIPGVVAATQALPAGLFSTVAQRLGTVTTQPAVTMTTVSSAASTPGQTEAKTQDRTSFQLPISINPEYIYNLPQCYQQLAQAAGFGSGSAAAAIRPNLGQAGGLTATLQASNVTTPGTVTQPGVRLAPPVMVSVDPTRAGGMTLQGPGQLVAATASESAAPSNLPQGAQLVGGSVGQLPISNAQPGHAPPTTTANQTASPRPTILRKRPNEGVTVVKRNLMNSSDGINMASDTLAQPSVQPTASTKVLTSDPSRENSQSSTDTASSTESTPQAGANTEVKVKEEPTESLESGAASGLAMFSAGMSSSVEGASPRKKPRKQLLLHREKDHTSSEDEMETIAKLTEQRNKLVEESRQEELEEYVDDEGVRWVRDRKRPPVSLMNHYNCTWKAQNNHFQKYSDVKVKDERRPTVNELSNTKGIQQKVSGWRIYHMAAQLEELMDLERGVYSTMSSVQETIAPKHVAKNPTMEDDISMVHELTQGNIQRCQLVTDQLEEARSSMLKLLDHKRRISEIISKHHSKRPVKKKERS